MTMKAMDKIEFYNLRSCSDGPMGRPGAKGMGTVMASFMFKQNVAFLFPYINSVAQYCEFHANLGLVRMELEGIHCVIYPDKCILSPLDDHDHAVAFAGRLIEFLNSVMGKKNEILPKSRSFEQAPVTKIIKILPGTNCGECGFKTCMAFAAMLSKQRAQPQACPYLVRPVRVQITYPVMDNKGRQLSEVTFPVDPHEPFFPSSNPSLSFPQQGNPEKKQDPVPSGPGCMLNGIQPEPLSPREIEVLSHMGQGLTNREISDLLFISPHTVKSHVVNIFNKLGVNHRVQAVVWAARQGIV
jgi:DNA-binding CsgD family transcriptional regulator/ArsR family metal-binding transcriptional regulator